MVWKRFCFFLLILQLCECKIYLLQKVPVWKKAFVPRNLILISEQVPDQKYSLYHKYESFPMTSPTMVSSLVNLKSLLTELNFR